MFLDVAQGLGLDQQHRELVAAEAGQHGLVVQRSAQACGDLEQHPVPDQVPERLVDLLEPVQVDDHHGQRHRSPGGCTGAQFGQRLRQALLEHLAVDQAGESVMLRQLAHRRRRAQAHALVAQQAQPFTTRRGGSERPAGQ